MTPNPLRTNPALDRAATAAVAVLLGLSAATADARPGSLVGALVGGAAAPVSAALGGRRSYDANTLRPEQLRLCLVSAHEIDEGGGRLDADRTSIERRATELHAAFDSLRADAARPGAKRAAIEQRSKALVQAEQALKVDIDAYNGALQALRARQQTFRTGCVGKRYHRADVVDLAPSLPFDVAAYTKR